MKVLQLFAHFTPEEYALLLEKYKDEGTVKNFLWITLKSSIKKECEEIKDEKIFNQLSQEEKL